MDTPLAAAVHKENVHIVGGKANVTVKPDKLKSAKTAVKKRKALADLRNAYGPAVGASKDVDLKPKFAAKCDDIVKKNPMTQGKKYAADRFTTKKHPNTGVPKGGNLKSQSVLQNDLGKANSFFNHMLTDEEIKKCYEWAEDGIEEMGGYSWSAKDDSNLIMGQSLSEIMASAIGVPVSEIEKPFMNDEEGYETDEPNMNGRLSSVFTQKELDDPLSVAGIVLNEYPLPELKLDDDCWNSN